MRFESKKEMAQALIDGRRFRSDNGYEIYFDQNCDEPFRLDSRPMNSRPMRGSWNYWFSIEWTEILPWYENIPEHGFLCWVWDEPEDKRHLKLVSEYLRDADYQYRSRLEIGYRNAIPITPEEAQKYIYQEPEK